MIRLTAFNIYTREFLHGLRNGLSNDAAGQKAMEVVKAAFLEDPTVKGLDQYETFDRWAQVYETLIDFRISTRNMPIDLSAIPPKAEMDSTLFGVPCPPATAAETAARSDRVIE